MSANSLPSVWNTPGPPAASNLPIELLHMIFGYCTEFDDLSVGLFCACPAWVVVTHVCSRWRAAALNCSSLWTLINNDTLGRRWIKAFMERSRESLIDVTLRIFPDTGRTGQLMNVDEVIALFTGCTRIRSLHIIGVLIVVNKLLGTLHTATHIRSLSLDIADSWTTPVELPDNLIGGQASIREVCFVSVSYIIAPHWLLRDITHFTSNQRIPFRILLDTLRQMPALHSLTLERRVVDWKGIDAPLDVQIPMQNLMYLMVDIDVGSPVLFALLLRRLALPNGAKKRLRSHRSSDPHSSGLWSLSILAIPPSVRDVIDAAGGLQHVRYSGGNRMGSFRLWTGDKGYEEAEFSIEFSWDPRESVQGISPPVLDLSLLCDLLGVRRVRRFEVLEVSPDKNDLWDLLEELSAVEELDLSAGAVRELRSAWDAGRLSIVLPRLRSVRIVKTGSTSDGAEMTEEEVLRVLRGNAKR